MVLRRLFFLFLLAAAASNELGAQLPPSGLLHHVDIPGLPASTVYSLAFDNDGFLWIGLSDGLCRYDGVNVDVFRKDPRDAATLPHNSVGHLRLLSDGRLLVGTLDGLATLDPRSLHFTRIAIPEAFRRMSQFQVMDLQPDKEGRVLISSLEYGVLRYHPKNNSLERIYPLVYAATRSPDLRGCTADEDGTLWAVSHDTLLHIQPETHATERFVFVDSPPNPAPRPLLHQISVDPTEPDRLIIRTWGSGIVCFNKRTRQFTNAKLPSDKPWNLFNIAFSALPFPSGAVLTGFNSQLRWYEPATNHLGPPYATNSDYSSESPDEFNALITGTDGRIWAGGTRGLYLLFEPAHQPVERFEQPGKSLGNILARAKDHDGYWSARVYERHTLFACDRNGLPYDSIRMPDGEKLQLDVWDIASTSNALVYLQTARGLWQYFPKTREFAHIPVQLPGNLGVMHNGLGGVLAADDGAVWISTHWGVFRSGGGGAPFLPVGQDSTNKDRWIPPQGSILKQLDKDHLLIGNTTGSITAVDLRTYTTTIITSDDPRALELADLIDIVVRPGGWIDAITRSNGVLSLRYANGAFTDVSTHREASAQETYLYGCADTLGNTWISTTTALVRFEPSTGTFTRFSQEDGFVYGGPERLLTDDRGGLLVYNLGWKRIDPARFTSIPPPHGLHIRGVRAQGEVVRNSSDTTAIQLAHDRNSITIEYAPIDPLHGKDRQYEVQLEGRDATWVDNGAQRTVSYVALPPGEYTFRVRIIGVEGAAGTTSLRFTIVPAFWQTTWFKVLAVLISALLVFLLSRYILRLQYQRRIAALEKEREVSTVRTRIARDIHDDLGSGLTRITMLSREMQSTSGAGVEKGKLAEHIANASSELIGQLGEIVWSVDPQNDRAEDFVAYVRNMLGNQFEELSIHLRTELSVQKGQEDRDIPPDVKRNALLILKELVSNALKHAQAKTISVQLHIAANALTLSVSDDGKGFDMAHTRPGGNGMGNLRKRAESIGGTLTMASNAQGTSSSLSVPLPSPTIMRGTNA